MPISRLFRAAALATAVLGAGPALSADNYKIGYLVDSSGPAQGIFNPTLEGFKLYIDKVNAEGGVHGRQIEILSRDVQIDPQRSVLAAQELIAEGAISLAGLTLTSTHMPVYTAVSRQNVPIVAGFPANVGAILPPKASKGFYGVGLAFEITGEVGGQLAKTAVPDGKKFLCAVFESPGGFVACESAMAGALAAGFESAEMVTFPVAQRDFRAIGERIAQMKPDVVVTIIGRGRTKSFVPALAQAGYEGALLSMECGTGDDELIEVAEAAPKIDVFSYSRYVGKDQGSGEQYDALVKAAEAAGINPLAFHSGGWVLAMVLTDALERCGPDCTPEKLDGALEQTSLDTGGLTGAPVKFTSTDHYGPTASILLHYNRETKKLDRIGDWLQSDSTPKHYSMKR
ncbi:MAG: ABC transporter substrate-binding protein [Rhizobiaceae bacterium]|nr:ABC transporter substrate-binding protein [Rhizobiaceae bacterium]